MGEQFESFLKHEKRFSVLTVRAYLDDVHQFGDFIHETYHLRDLSRLDTLQVRSWIVQLMKEKISPRSINRKLSALRTYYRFLKREKIISVDPMIRIKGPKTEKRLPEFVDEEKLSKLFSPEIFSKDFMGLRDKTILEFFYATGVRRAELIGLKVKDVDLAGASVKVMGKRAKERIIPLHPELKQNLEKYLEYRSGEAGSDSEWVFLGKKGQKLNPRDVYRIVNQYLELVTTLKKKSPHVLRHSFATHLLNRGADLNAIKELLGHANLSATQIYTHNSIGELQKIYKNSHPRS